jgi:hypothetical protein
MPRSREPCCSCSRRSLWGAGMPRSLRQSSPAQKLARLSPRGHCALLRASFPRRLRNSLCEACRAPISATAAWRALNATRSINQRRARPQRPSGPALRGFGSREGGTNSAFGGGCQPRRATDVSASETWWSERVRAARARGRERTSAERACAPWWSERVRAARARGRERTARSNHSRPSGASASAQPGPEGAGGRRGATTRALVERARPRSQGPRAREDGAEQPLAP